MEIKSDRVDLTENRDFGDSTFRDPDRIRFNREKVINIEDLIHIDLDCLGADLTEYVDPREAFLTGSVKNIRIHKKEMELMGYGDIRKCDRCGKKLRPWEDSGICEACFDHVENQVLHKVPWEN